MREKLMINFIELCARMRGPRVLPKYSGGGVVLGLSEVVWPNGGFTNFRLDECHVSIKKTKETGTF